jgi:cold shock CspA family protein
MMQVHAFLGLSHPAPAGQRSRSSSKPPASGIALLRFVSGAGVSLVASLKATIKRLVAHKGFGFVADEKGAEYFFQQSACHGSRFDRLREGQMVSLPSSHARAHHGRSGTFTARRGP